jgi:acetyl esterase/lipase
MSFDASKLRFAWAGSFFAWSLLTVFRAPDYPLWLLALIAGECGHWLIIPALFPLWPGWRKTGLGRFAAALSIAAAALFLSPAVRARAGFSHEAFSLLRMWTGVPVGETQESTQTYARDCGGSLNLQLFLPTHETGLRPVVIVIHGGSWQSGSRLDMPELSRHLAAKGYAVASIDYGLAPREKFPAPVADVRDALAYLSAHSREWSLDMSRVALLGRSAGAQIALAAAAENLPGVRAVVDFYGPNDMSLTWTIPGSKAILDSRQLLVQYLGGSPAEFPKQYEAASALYRVERTFPPVIMIHGRLDQLVWPLNQLRLSARLKALGIDHEFLELPWATHGCDYFPSGPCGQLSTFAVERFLARNLK